MSDEFEPSQFTRTASGEEADDGLLACMGAFLDAFAALQWDDFRGFFAEDATVFFPRADRTIRAQGRDEIEQGFGLVFAQARADGTGPIYLSLQPHDLHVQSFGDVAVITFHLYDPGILCRRTFVWQRQADGWQIVHLHGSNMPVQPQIIPTS
jgi:ketosteroid isomerase-like protein